MPGDLDSLYQGLGLYVDHYSPRSRLNVFYRQRALGLLTRGEGADDFRWLADKRAMESGRRKGCRPSILTELGRIEDEESMRAVARRICELKPSAKEAVALIRRWRLGDKQRPGRAIDLADELARLVDDYRARHPEMTWDQIREAVITLGHMVEETAGR